MSNISKEEVARAKEVDKCQCVEGTEKDGICSKCNKPTGTNNLGDTGFMRIPIYRKEDIARAYEH